MRSNHCLFLRLPVLRHYYYSSTAQTKPFRRYSTSTIHVPCRSNGHITLSLFHPLIASGSSGGIPPVILYLPPGPALPSTNPTVNVAAALSSVTSAIVVQINYRCSQDHPYPTPIHDVLAGYDWVLEHLIPDRAFSRPGRSPSHAVKLGVCGELVGGSLATMLALTECRIQGPYIAAAAVNEPIMDWVFHEDEDLDSDSDAAADRIASFLQGLESRRKPNKARSKSNKPSFSTFADNGIVDSHALLMLRQQVFRRPADYFDTFASPLFNFRTPAVSVPPPPPTNVLDEFAELATYEREDFHRQQLRLSSISQTSSSITCEDRISTEPSKPPRKSLRRWPNAGSGLKIPHFHISSAETSPLSDQAREFTKYVQKSVMARELTTSMADSDDAAKEAAYVVADRQIQLAMSDTIRLWSQGHTHDLRNIAHWFERILA